MPPNTDSQTTSLIKLGKRLKDRRIIKNLTQKDVAAKLFLDRTHISKMEHGNIAMPLFRFIEYCSILEVSAGDLINELTAPPPRSNDDPVK